jgi:DNA ligase-1
MFGRGARWRCGSIRRWPGLLLFVFWLLPFWGRAAAPELLLAEVDDGSVDPAAYWVSEKYDGVRAFWDGRVLRFRSGRPIAAPAWFLAALPATPLDGELWLGRGQFTALVGIVRKARPVDGEWRRVRYLLFEQPGAPGGFTERRAALAQIAVRQNVAWLVAAPQFRVADRKELADALQRVLAEGGEGLMLHRADAPYQSGRSAVLLKVVPEREAEAMVVGHIAGKGALRGRMGALRVRSAAGVEFVLGSGFDLAERRDPPPIGSRVTYRYRELGQNGVPRFARYLRRFPEL